MLKTQRHRGMALLAALLLGQCTAWDAGALLQLRSHGGQVMDGKHQVLIPKPAIWTSGKEELRLTEGKLKVLKEVAKSAGEDRCASLQNCLVSSTSDLFPDAFVSFHASPEAGDPRDRREGYMLKVTRRPVQRGQPWAMEGNLGAQLWIKVLIAALSEFKINVLHLHLTDTASWPLEIDGYPEITEALSYRDASGKALTYSRGEIRELVESHGFPQHLPLPFCVRFQRDFWQFARLRGVSILPEIDGPMHAPALAAALGLTVAATVEFSVPKFAVEPPPGTWNISNPKTLKFVKTALQQVEEDFSTAPFVHVGGDEPTAASLCVLLDPALRKKCWEQCKVTWALGCAPIAPRAVFFGSQFQQGFGVAEPSYVHNTSANHTGYIAAPWGYPSSWLQEDCEKYDLIQSAATYPQSGSDYGWLYMDCGSGANWISMGPDYWCPRASWAALYALNSTQGYGAALKTPRCQRAFRGAEMALWSEIGGMGNGMSLIFPRAAAFAERMWSNPQALDVEQMTNGQPPEDYWESHLKDALARLNEVVANFELLHLGVSHLQPEFCRVHPEYCSAYTSGLYES
eukprot:Skav231259  [mRNA]  locus=scaffold411:784483:793747:- [translate_table: standard]